MKKYVLIVLFTVIAIAVHSQNYKALKIDASGKVTNAKGKHIGTVTTDGTINDVSGNKIAYVDSEGTLIDAKTGKKLGKAEKNGNFSFFEAKTNDKGWTTDSPLNGTCLVKDEKGNVKAEVHENYKQFGACAAHCLEHHMDHHGIGEQHKDLKHTKNYACSMHPDVTSDKPGKCSKCGMELTEIK